MAFIVPGIYHSHERLGVPAKAADDEAQRISPRPRRDASGSIARFGYIVATRKP
jgi:hypothetical protein